MPASKNIDCKAILFSTGGVDKDVIENVAARIHAVSHEDGAGHGLKTIMLEDFQASTGIPNGYTNMHIFQLAPQSGIPNDSALTRLEGKIGKDLMSTTAQQQPPDVSLIPARHGLYGGRGDGHFDVMWVGLSYPKTFIETEAFFTRYEDH